MNTRRLFIQILPLAGLSALSACGDKTATQPAAAAPDAAPAAYPAAPPTAPATAATSAPPSVTAATNAVVDPADAAAVALGYVSDANTTKDAKYVAGAACVNCALYGGKAGDPSGPCPLFAGKQVLATGWCTAYAKKA